MRSDADADVFLDGNDANEGEQDEERRSKKGRRNKKELKPERIGNHNAATTAHRRPGLTHPNRTCSEPRTRTRVLLLIRSTVPSTPMDTASGVPVTPLILWPTPLPRVNREARSFGSLCEESHVAMSSPELEAGCAGEPTPRRLTKLSLVPRWADTGPGTTWTHASSVSSFRRGK